MSDILKLRGLLWEHELILPKVNQGIVERASYASDVVFVNLGTTTAYINEMPLLPNTSVAYSGTTETITVQSFRIQSDIPNGKLGVWMIRGKYNGQLISIV